MTTRERRAVAALMAVAVAAGAGLRIARYAVDRSLWADEAFLALNILHRSFSGLAQPLDYYQGAPVFFLWAEKGVTGLFGDGSLSLRLLPMLASVAALPLMALLARRLLDPVPAVIAVAGFAVSGPLVTYAAQVKPYAFDVPVAIAVMLLAVRCLDGDRRAFSALAAAGILAPWLSLASPLVLAPAWVVLAARALQRRRTHEMWPLLAMGVAWIASAATQYALALRGVNAFPLSPTRPQSGFVPSGPFDFHWYRSGGLPMLHTSMGAPSAISLLYAIIILVGAVALLRGRPWAGAIVLLPVPASLIAAIAQRFAWGARFTLFIDASLFIALAAGVVAIAGVLRARPAIRTTAASALGALAVAAVLVNGAGAVTAPSQEEVRPVLRELAARRAPGDVIAVDYWAQYAYALEGRRLGLPLGGPIRLSHPHRRRRSYAPALGSAPPTFLVGPRRYAGLWLQRALAKFAGRRRVWLVLAHSRDVPNEAASIGRALSVAGHFLAAYPQPGALVELWAPNTSWAASRGRAPSR